MRKSTKTMPSKFALQRLLMLPYVRAKLFFNSSKDRTKKLELAKKLYLSFMGLLDFYGILPVQIKVVMEKLAKEGYRAEREEKIARYKAGKTAEQEAINVELKFRQGSAKKRDYLKAIMYLKAFQAVTDLEMIPQELEMLQFRKKLETDNEFKQRYDAEMAKPRPKPYFHKIDDGSEGGKPMNVHSRAIKNVGGTPVHNCGHTKLDVQDTLWQPDHAQPKMTMDEHADLEVSLMYAKMDREKEQQRVDQERMDRLTEHEKDDLDTFKARAWDDWKDDNEKGAGNKMK
jgi:immunoglobulin-binding protein 1